MISTLLIIFVCTVILAIVLNNILLKLSENVGIRNQDHSNIIRWSSSNKPALGGIGFYTIFLISSIIYLIYYRQLDTPEANPSIVGLISSCTLAFVMGLADDAYNTRPWLKFGVQVMCGVILIVTGNYIVLSDLAAVNYFLTIFWVVGIMNAINLLDNMDAISSITASFIIITVMLVLSNLRNGFTPEFIIPIGVLSSLVGFLFYNWSPSKMFMGDTGSQFLGAFISAISILYMWNLETSIGTLIESKSILLVLITFALPIFDTTIVFMKRIARGQSPFVGGKDHTTHHFSYLGLTDRQVALTFAFISCISLGLVLYAIFYVDKWTNFHNFIYSIYLILLFAVLYSVASKNQEKSYG